MLIFPLNLGLLFQGCNPETSTASQIGISQKKDAHTEKKCPLLQILQKIYISYLTYSTCIPSATSLIRGSIQGMLPYNPNAPQYWPIAPSVSWVEGLWLSLTNPCSAELVDWWCEKTCRSNCNSCIINRCSLDALSSNEWATVPSCITVKTIVDPSSTFAPQVLCDELQP